MNLEANTASFFFSLIQNKEKHQILPLHRRAYTRSHQILGCSQWYEEPSSAAAAIINKTKQTNKKKKQFD